MEQSEGVPHLVDYRFGQALASVGVVSRFSLGAKARDDALSSSHRGEPQDALILVLALRRGDVDCRQANDDM